jgi:GT2 family glycosyltransferase
MTPPAYSFVIPTYRRPADLADCLESLCALQYPLDAIEVIVIDNGGEANSAAVADGFNQRLFIRYIVNARNRGYGFSVNRGIAESRGERIVLLNDDARPAADFLIECDRLLAADSTIGCVGCRAIEAVSDSGGEGIGRITDTGQVTANFNVDCGAPIEVEHVYGFCYVFTREAVRRAGLNDRTLLAKPYSSGNRIETDHCLTIREQGLRVMFDPRLVAVHLAQPRGDMSERSARWKLNMTRNTLYLFLKHYGLFGKRGAALRLTFLQDVGLRSTLRRPTSTNFRYLLLGLRARASAYAHFVRYLLGPRIDSVEAFKSDLARETGTALLYDSLPVRRSESR